MAPYISRGLVYFSKGDYDRAIADYTEVVRLDPNPRSLTATAATVTGSRVTMIAPSPT